MTVGDDYKILELKERIGELEKKMGVFDKIDIIQTQIEEIKEQFTKWVGEFGNETLKYKEEIEELEKWKGIINKDHQKAVIDIDKLEKKIDLLDMEKSLKRLWDHKHPIMIHEILELKELCGMKRKQVERIDELENTTHELQLKHEGNMNRIAELKERDLQLRKIMRFWIARYPLKEKTIMDLLDSKEGIKLCQFELPKGEGVLDEPREDEHFIIRDDGTPNNPILRALFFVGGDEECILDWRFRYKREYFEIVKREDLQFMVKNISLIYGHEFEEKLKYFKEEYSI